MIWAPRNTRRPPRDSRKSTASIPIRCGRPRRRSWPPSPTTNRTSTTTPSSRSTASSSSIPAIATFAYAYYLKALCYYEQISDVGRDQRVTQQALDALAEVVKRFSGSPYARDARLKVELAIDHLAGKEMAVGRYYQKNQQYVGAINRYRVVIERYQTTTHVPEALHRLVESYLALGVKSEAKENARPCWATISRAATGTRTATS